MDAYVESGYVEAGYVDGDSVIYDPSLASRKKINFVIDNQGLSDENINALLLSKHGETYVDDVNIIFGSSLKVAERVGGVFLIKEIVGGISQAQLDAIDAKIPKASDFEAMLPTVEDIKAQLLADTGFIGSISGSVLSNISVNLVAQNGDVITSSLTYNEENSSYVLDYDTSLLDGTEYTIELKLN